MRRVRTASGAVAVQVVTKERGVVTEVEHIGSAHTDAELALLLRAARDLLHDGQDALDLGVLDQARVSTRDVGDWTRPDLDVAQPDVPRVGRPRTVTGGGTVVRSDRGLPDLWQVERSFWMAKSDLRARPIFHRPLSCTDLLHRISGSLRR